MVRLQCPFCRAVVIDGPESAPGVCGGCGAQFAGNASTAQDAVAAALTHWGSQDDPAAMLAAVFANDPADAATRAAIVSDEREGFYNWWVFRR